MEHIQTYIGWQTISSNHVFQATIIVDNCINGLYLQFGGWNGEATTVAASRTFGCHQDNRRCSQPERVASHRDHSSATAPAQRAWHFNFASWHRFEWNLFFSLGASETKPAVDVTMRGKSINILILSCGSRPSNSFTIHHNGHNKEESGSHLWWSLMSRIEKIRLARGMLENLPVSIIRGNVPHLNWAPTAR